MEVQQISLITAEHVLIHLGDQHMWLAEWLWAHRGGTRALS